MSRNPDSGKNPSTDRPSSVLSERRKFLAGAASGLGVLAAGGAPGLLGASTRAPESMPWENGAGRFKDQVVLITGATSGIGEATARAFAAEGAKVFFCGRREDRGRSVQDSIRTAGGEAAFMRADVREEQQVEAFVNGCVERYGRLDIAFNNAGIEGPRGGYDEIALAGDVGYHDVMRTNVDGVIFAMRHELKVMRPQGNGVIINTASVLGSRGSAASGVYAASKHAVIGLTRSAALAHARENIRILSLSPGGTETDLLRRGFADNLEAVARSNPSGRIASPKEQAAAVLNLAAPEMAFLSGDDVKVDGGSSA